jgi:hypothetical protein
VVVERKRGRREDEQLLALDEESAEMRGLRKRRIVELLGDQARGYLAQEERDARELRAAEMGRRFQQARELLEKREQEAERKGEME